MKESVGEEHYIDVYSALQEHAGELIYYRTDHHWTSLGAYYGFLAWADNMGKFPYPYNTAGMKTVSEDFQGTLQSRINVRSRMNLPWRLSDRLWSKCGVE